MDHIDLQNKTILVTGAAGFIGANLVKRLLAEVRGAVVVGIDNMSDYYDVSIKEYRLKEIDEMEKAEGTTFTFIGFLTLLVCFSTVKIASTRINTGFRALFFCQIFKI